MAVYLIHFEKPFKHARHYIGFCESLRNVPIRLEHHRHGRGSRLLKAVSEAGIAYDVVQVWKEGDRTFERKLKRHGRGQKFCPVCKSLTVKTVKTVFTGP